MKARKQLLSVALGGAAAVLSLGASAQIANPDNDSATFFKYAAAPASARPAAALRQVGELSSDGLYGAIAVGRTAGTASCSPVGDWHTRLTAWRTTLRRPR